MEELKKTASDAASQATETAEKVQDKVQESLTLLWNQIDPWQQDNHYIHSGYRPASNSYRKSIGSLTYLHNETVNIYSHLIGFIIAILGSGFSYRELSKRYETATKDDVIVFGCFFFGAAGCLGMSATYHLISNHSPEVASFGNKLDYLGIVLLIWGSFVPSIYYGFQEEPGYMKIYWTMITTIGAGCAAVSVSPKFRTPTWRPFRAAMFVAMGMSAVFPVLHGLRIYSITELNDRIGLYWLVTQGVLYVAGAGLYAARVPERLKPGGFDIWGSSHQIFHVLVLLAAGAHLVGLLNAFDFQHSRPDPPAQVPVTKMLWPS